MPKIKKLKPEDVFTPRSADVNPDMYISRDEHEKALVRALRGSKNVIIYGESGCGKSWLYKKKFSEMGAKHITANMANVSRLGSINEIFADRYTKLKNIPNTGKTVDASINLGIVNFKRSVFKNAERSSKEPFERIIHALGGILGGERCYIVIENIESIIEQQKHIDDIAGLITLVDDEDYAQYNCKLVIVGVPDDVQRYLSKSKFGQTISNRLVEVPEVERLNNKAAEELLRKGFVDILGMQLDKGVSIQKIAWHADFIPQHLHEVGLEIAYCSEAENKITKASMNSGIQNWMQTTFTSDYTVIEGKMNSRSTKAGRRNQTIYTIANIDQSDFKATDVELSLRKFFPKSTRGVSLNLPQMLAELAESPTPLIRRTPKGDAFRFVSPKVKVCIRGILSITKDERIEKVPFDKINAD